MQPLKQSRIKINEFPQGIEIIITAKRNYILAFFLAFWVAGWGFGELAVIKELLKLELIIPKFFLFIWLSAWSVAGIYAIFSWLWNINGKEIIRIDAHEFKHQRIYTFFSRSINYQVTQIKNLHVASNNASMFKPSTGIRHWGISGGKIEFDYEGNLYRFGSDLNAEDADMMIQKINDKYQYRSA